MSKLPADLQIPLQVAGQGFLSLARTLRPTDPADGQAQAANTESDSEELADVVEIVGLSYSSLASIPEIFETAGRQQRGSYNRFPKSEDYFRKSLSWPSRWFRSQYRMSRTTFDKVVGLLEKNSVFISKGKKPQRPVKFQLACFLLRYGTRGADTLEPATKLSLGHGTVFLYCRRVVYALRCLRRQYVKWPNQEGRREIAEAVEELTAIPGVIGIVDGSLIPFSRIPKDEPHLWFTRKKFPGANIQATVDHLRRFTSYELGHCGSVPDVTIFKQSHLWMHRPAYFEQGQIILADKGYPCSPYTLRPFAENELGSDAREKARRRKFNKALSGQRIEVEHAFGDLKGRFPALKCIGGTDNLAETFRAIEALLILHNICIEFGDNAADIPDFTVDDIYPPGTDEEDEEDIEEVQEITAWVGLANGMRNRPGETDESMKRRGKALRMDILDIVVPP